jgi:hypothetical protein
MFPLLHELLALECQVLALLGLALSHEANLLGRRPKLIGS